MTIIGIRSTAQVYLEKKNKVLICTISLKPATKTICHISVVAQLRRYTSYINS